MACASPAFAQELPDVLIQSKTRLLPWEFPGELQPGDLLALDLDNTVFREDQLLGTDDWYAFTEHMLRKSGLSFDEAEARLHPLNFKIKSATRMRLMEPGIPAWIRELQNTRNEKGEKINVIGITARHPDFADLTIRQLKELGIQFAPQVFTSENMRDLHVPDSVKPRPFFRDGVTFVRNERKGYVLRAMLKLANYRPKKVIAVDDRIHHVHSFVEALTEERIPGHVVHYLKAQEEPPFEPKIVEIQTRYFEATGHLLTDERARRECELQFSEEEAKFYRNPDNFTY